VAGRVPFGELAAAVSKDTHARALLDELLRSGSVREEGDDVVLLRRQPGTRSRQAQLAVGSANVSDHLSAVLMNMLAGEAPLTERAIFADGLTERSAREGVALAQELWETALPGLRERLQGFVDQDEGATDNQWRMRLGVYAYLAPMQRPSAPVSARVYKSARGARTRRKSVKAASDE
jgi:hypothetical protein